MDIKALATDLDGTLIPLKNNPQQQEALRIIESRLAEHHLSLLFVTGRHFASVQQAMVEFQLPQPDEIICDVGTTILRRTADDDGHSFRADSEYSDHLSNLVGEFPATALIQQFADNAALRLQECEKQGDYKVSFYTDAGTLKSVAAYVQQVLTDMAAPWSIISSVDPFNGDGLIDLLPAGVSKAYAITWWAQRRQFQPSQVVFAGDSGNDTAALTAGYLAIVVGNASPEVVAEVVAVHNAASWNNRCFHSQQHATSGVLNGLEHHLHVHRTKG